MIAEPCFHMNAQCLVQCTCDHFHSHENHAYDNNYSCDKIFDRFYTVGPYGFHEIIIIPNSNLD